MGNETSIVIGDRSAATLYAHSPSLFIKNGPTRKNPLNSCASTSAALHDFNYSHPLYGGLPVTLLVASQKQRRATQKIDCRSVQVKLPSKSFYELREGLYIAAPELVFARMGLYLDVVQLAELGMNLCARFFIGPDDGISDRPFLLTTPELLGKYLDRVSGMRGATKARKALALIIGNSGSPAETKMALQFCSPLRLGGFGLPLTAMNYDVHAGRLSDITEQRSYSIDLAAPSLKFGVEYDGELYHVDASKDKRRRNELKALGWETFPIDKRTLYSPRQTLMAGEQIAKCLHWRLRRSGSWESSFKNLRASLGLPV